MQVDQAVDAIPQFHHADHAGRGGGVQPGLYHDAVLPEVHLAVHHGVGVVLHIGVCGDGGLRYGFFLIAQFRHLHFRDLAVDAPHRFMELLGKVRALDGEHGIVLVPILGALRSGPPQYHLRVRCEIVVDGEALRRLTGPHPVRHNVDEVVPLLQEDDVGDYFRPGVGLERIVGQADSPQQLGPLRQIPAYLLVLGVQGITGGEKRHDAARTYLVQRLGKEIVMDVEAQLVVGRVIDRVLSKGHVADCHIKKAVWKVYLFKPAHGDPGLWIEEGRDAPGDAVQLHAVELTARHGLRQQAEEVADAAGGFQNIALLEAEITQGLIDRLDNGWTGIVGVQGGGPGGGVFALVQQPLQLCIFCVPVLLVLVKDLGQTAPAHIAGEDLLFRLRCAAPLQLNRFQGADGFHIPPVLLLRPALTQMVVCDVEVASRRHGGTRP